LFLHFLHSLFFVFFCRPAHRAPGMRKLQHKAWWRVLMRLVRPQARDLGRLYRAESYLGVLSRPDHAGVASPMQCSRRGRSIASLRVDMRERAHSKGLEAGRIGSERCGSFRAAGVNGALPELAPAAQNNPNEAAAFGIELKTTMALAALLSCCCHTRRSLFATCCGSERNCGVSRRRTEPTKTDASYAVYFARQECARYVAAFRSDESLLRSRASNFCRSPGSRTRSREAGFRQPRLGSAGRFEGITPRRSRFYLARMFASIPLPTDAAREGRGWRSAR
jgi:hypothetical protein